MNNRRSFISQACVSVLALFGIGKTKANEPIENPKKLPVLEFDESGECINAHALLTNEPWMAIGDCDCPACQEVLGTRKRTKRAWISQKNRLRDFWGEVEISELQYLSRLIGSIRQVKESNAIKHRKKYWNMQNIT